MSTPSHLKSAHLKSAHFLLGLLITGSCFVCGPAFADERKASDSKIAKTVSADHASRAKLGLTLFKEKVRGLLSDHCLDCHGGKSVKADFDLSTRESLFESGFVGEQADDSHLMELITHAAEPSMPKQAERLPDEAIESIGAWINLGAPYDRPLTENQQQPAAGPRVITDDDRSFWSFQPLRVVPVPEVQQEDWCRTTIDRFILARQEAAGLMPNPQADPRTLVRRASFDLLGLPADQSDVDRLREENKPSQWSAFVDDLLNSKHYGERWARHWMDVARFAESHGYEQDYDRPHAYHYRDFLIQAFNQDMPFHQFLRWQLAGDELAPDDPLALMATGFLGAGAFPTQLTEAEFESARYDELDDMVTTTGVAFLGLSVGCARCHDHKFDPIPSVDYYRMAATFTTAIRSELELDLTPDENRRRQLDWDKKLVQLEEQLTRFEREELPDRFSKWIVDFDPTKSQSSWSTLDVTRIESSAGTKYESQSDGSWLAVGNTAPKEVLTIVAESELSKATKLRLEALTHDSLPRRGPGRADNGNFALGNISVSIVPLGKTDGESAADAASEAPSVRQVVLQAAKATHQQNTAGLSIAASLDEDPISGWAVDAGGIGTDQAAVFEFAETIELPRDTRWNIRLTFNHPNTKHAIGRLRLSVTDRQDAPVEVGSDGLDPRVRTALLQAKSTGKKGSESWKVAESWFASTLPSWQALKKAVTDHKQKGPGTVKTKVMVTSEGLPHMKHHADGRGFPHFYPETYVLSRGDVHQKQQIATPGFLQVLKPENLEESNWKVTSADEEARTSFRRAALANWMTDVQQGAGALAARVIVNRVWQHHFGRGLVSTPNDFGVAGELPTHPDLLDWLAHDLVEHGWQLKRLHHMIMTSSVYMQTRDHDETRASVDRDNLMLWRWTPRRLEAEAIRDSMLAVSGQLDPKMYGPGTLDQQMNRRSVYFFIKRSKLIPMMMLFDWPEHLVSIGQRSSTTIAPQALMFLNSSQGRRYSEAFAKRLPQDDRQQAVREAYRLAFVREPSEQEISMGLGFLEAQEAIYRERNNQNPEQAALTDLCQTLMSMNEFIYID